jgi:hypothetical protein
MVRQPPNGWADVLTASGPSSMAPVELFTKRGGKWLSLHTRVAHQSYVKGLGG